MILNDYKCTVCSFEFEDDSTDATRVCPFCGKEATKQYRAAACLGLSDGPGSKVSNYRRSDLKKEVRDQLAAMEKAGHLRDPQKMKQAEATLKQINDMPDSRTKIDYDKKGYPF